MTDAQFNDARVTKIERAEIIKLKRIRSKPIERFL